MTLRTTHILGIVGAVVVFVATAITWYTHDISVAAQAGQVAYKSSSSYTLGDITTLGTVLLFIAAAAAAILTFAPSSGARAAGAVAGFLGLAIAAYCIVRMFNFPDLGTTGGVSGLLPFSGARGVGVDAQASTDLSAGPFVGLLGGALLAAAGLQLTSEAPEASRVSSRPGATAAGAPS
jgi:hypothetical protein